MGKADLIIPLGLLGLGYYLYKAVDLGIEGPPKQPIPGERGRKRIWDWLDGTDDDSDPLDTTDTTNGINDIITTNGNNDIITTNGNGGIIETIENIFKTIVPPKFISVERPDAWWDIPAYTPVSPDYIQAGEGIDEWI